MRLCKRMICILMCFALLLPLLGCGVPEEPATVPAGTQPPVVPETLSVLESYLEIARGFIDSGEYSHAFAVLELAWELEEDPRITAMQDEIKRLDPNYMPTPREQIEAILLELEQTAEGLTVTPDIDREAAMAVDTSMVTPLNVVRSLIPAYAKDSVQPYGKYWFFDMPREADLSDSAPLLYTLTYSDKTEFPEKIAPSFDPEGLMRWGMDPGLNVSVLHGLGYTGKGAVIGYVDQPAGDHSEYDSDNIHRFNNTDNKTSMHGSAVLSLLAGENIGTAPEAEVYFYGAASWEGSHVTSAECLYQIIELNKSLPPEERITMVGFSDNISYHKTDVQALIDAVAACEEAGIMVWFCGEYASAAFLPMTDRNDPRNAIPDAVYGGSAPLVHVPAGSRTTAATEDGARNIYWGSGGISWTMPYMLGIYAIVTEIDPSLTQADLRKMVVETAWNTNGMLLVNPVEFVAAALEGVGRTEDAAVLRAAAADNTCYTYAVMNKSAMTPQDIEAAENYLRNFTDSTVLVVDSSGMRTAGEVYTVLQADHIKRGGKVAGVQILGNSDLVPSFPVIYKVQMDSGVDNMGGFFSDLFYGNFNNSLDYIGNGYNVMDHFAENWPVQLVPDWKVARLPLAGGEFSAFFRKYDSFMGRTGLGQLPIVSFSNPIFMQTEHIDDMGVFLNRMAEDFGVLGLSYRLYGNQEGEYPVTTATLGGFTAENLTMENQSGVCEFLINSHGQWNNVDKCFFVNGAEKRESLFNMGNVNTVFGSNPYYLDMWTCENGWDMRNNLTTVALNGQCVGMFSATHIISNNGVMNSADIRGLTRSNFFWFYLCYLDALNSGASRSDAFFMAQRAYGNSLIADSVNGIREGDGNYQFNLCNLLSYHNFGVLEPCRAFVCINSRIA